MASIPFALAPALVWPQHLNRTSVRDAPIGSRTHDQVWFPPLFGFALPRPLGTAESHSAHDFEEASSLDYRGRCVCHTVLSLGRRRQHWPGIPSAAIEAFWLDPCPCFLTRVRRRTHGR